MFDQGELDNPQHELFCREYVIDFKTGRAARAAGYSPDNCDQQGYILKLRPEIRARIKELTRKKLSRADCTADRVMQELARVAFSDIRDMFDEEGNLLPIHELSDDAAAAVAGIDVEYKVERGRDDDGNPTQVVSRVAKIRRAPKMDALKVLAQHLKLIGPTSEEVADSVMAFARALEAANRRAPQIQAPAAPFIEMPEMVKQEQRT